MKRFQWKMAVVLILALGLCGCEGRSGSSAKNVPVEMEEYSAPMAASNSMDSGFAMEAAGDIYEEEEADAEAKSAAAVVGGGPAQQTEKKIVWSGYLRLETTEYETTLQEMKDLFAKYGVIVESSEEYDGNSWYSGSSDSSRTMNWQLRIPSDKFDSFFADTGSLTGQIRSKSTTSSDRTKQYNDTAVQIESLTIQQENLMEMMKKAETIEEMLAIEDRLTELRTELRLLNNTNAQIDYDVEYSSITAEVQEVHVYNKQEITYGERLRSAFGNSVIDFVEAMGDLLVSLIYLLPYLIVIGLIWFLTKGLRKRFSERRAAKKAEKQMKNQAARTKYTYTGPEEKSPEEEK